MVKTAIFITDENELLSSTEILKTIFRKNVRMHKMTLFTCKSVFRLRKACFISLSVNPGLLELF